MKVKRRQGIQKIKCNNHKIKTEELCLASKAETDRNVEEEITERTRNADNFTSWWVAYSGNEKCLRKEKCAYVKVTVCLY
jgi:hypothetical protein